MTVAETLKFVAKSGWRLGVLIVGAAITAAGLVLLVTPGPGLLLLVAGLGILATEFAWARRLRDRAVDSAKRGARRITGRRAGSVDQTTAPGSDNADHDEDAPV
jgi:uncharacterized protein (TIGR02611 family)